MMMTTTGAAEMNPNNMLPPLTKLPEVETPVALGRHVISPLRVLDCTLSPIVTQSPNSGSVSVAAGKRRQTAQSSPLDLRHLSDNHHRRGDTVDWASNFQPDIIMGDGPRGALDWSILAPDDGAAAEHPTNTKKKKKAAHIPRDGDGEDDHHHQGGDDGGGDDEEEEKDDEDYVEEDSAEYKRAKSRRPAKEAVAPSTVDNEATIKDKDKEARPTNETERNAAAPAEAGPAVAVAVAVAPPPRTVRKGVRRSSLGGGSSPMILPGGVPPSMAPRESLSSLSSPPPPAMMMTTTTTHESVVHAARAAALAAAQQAAPPTPLSPPAVAPRASRVSLEGPLASPSQRGGEEEEEEEVVVVLGGAEDPEENNNNNRGLAVEVVAKPCNCKKSRCLKLYCECFANGLFCAQCNCTNCGNTNRDDPMNYRMSDAEDHNNVQPLDKMVAMSPGVGATTALSGRSPDSTPSKRVRRSDTSAQKRSRRNEGGCSCKRSLCLKKYCECFEAGQTCVPSKCKCAACQNFPGSAELEKSRAKQASKPSRSGGGGGGGGSASKIVMIAAATPRTPVLGGTSSSFSSAAAAAAHVVTLRKGDGLASPDRAAQLMRGRSLTPRVDSTEAMRRTAHKALETLKARAQAIETAAAAAARNVKETRAAVEAAATAHRWSSQQQLRRTKEKTDDDFGLGDDDLLVDGARPQELPERYAAPLRIGVAAAVAASKAATALDDAARIGETAATETASVVGQSETGAEPCPIARVLAAAAADCAQRATRAAIDAKAALASSAAASSASRDDNENDENDGLVDRGILMMGGGDAAVKQAAHAVAKAAAVDFAAGEHAAGAQLLADAQAASDRAEAAAAKAMRDVAALSRRLFDKAGGLETLCRVHDGFVNAHSNDPPAHAGFRAPLARPTLLKVLDILDNEDVYATSLLNKSCAQLAMSPQIWSFF